VNIIIAGIGKGGIAVMRQLLAEGHTVTVIDKDTSALARVADGYDAMPICGDCLTMDTLKEAGARQANLLISFTGSDETNLLCCLVARKLNPKLHTIPRIRNPEYIKLSADLRDEFGISMVVNPDRDAAKEIYMLMQFPAFLQRETFAKGRVEIVQLRVKEGSKLCQAPISGLSSLLGCKVLVCAVVRDGQAFIPKGGGVLQAGDSVYVTASHKVLSLLIRNLGIASKKIKHVMIVGADRTSVYLVRSLLDQGISVKIIENDPERSAQLDKLFPKATVITDDGASQDVLNREGCSQMDALITLTGLDEVNMIVSMYGASQNVEKVITKINRIESPELLNGLNVGSIVSSTHICSAIVAQYARAMRKKSGSALTVHPIAGGQVEAVEFVVEDDARYAGQPLKNIPIRSDVLICCIMHKGNTVIADGESIYERGDTVVVAAPENASILQFNDIFA